jgi:hypothetical protein
MRGEKLAGAMEMGEVQHPPVESDRADVGLGFEGGDHPPRLHHVLRGRRERLVDNIDLAGMDSNAPREALPPGEVAGRAKPLWVLEVRVERVDRLNTRRVRRQKTGGPDDLMGEVPVAVCSFVRRRADCRAQVLSAPGQGYEARQIKVGLGAKSERRDCGLGGD